MKEIIIPELEEYRETGKIYAGGTGAKWSREEEAIIKKYYGYAPVQVLLKHLPGRNTNQVMSKASRMGLTNRERE